MNIDEFEKMLEADELNDQPYMKPVQYAKLRGLYPQQVYGWMRNGTLTSKRCDCGSRVIEVYEADELLRAKGKLPPVLITGDEDEAYECPICESMGAPTDHEPYDDPKVGDQFHGQYDPEHPEEIYAYAEREGS
jgi:hypothetical protein